MICSLSDKSVCSAALCAVPLKAIGTTSPFLLFVFVEYEYGTRVEGFRFFFSPQYFPVRIC